MEAFNLPDVSELIVWPCHHCWMILFYINVIQRKNPLLNLYILTCRISIRCSFPCAKSEKLRQSGKIYFFSDYRGFLELSDRNRYRTWVLQVKRNKTSNSISSIRKINPKIHGRYFRIACNCRNKENAKKSIVYFYIGFAWILRAKVNYLVGKQI